MPNIVDEWFLGLIGNESLKGWGIIIYIFVTLFISTVLSFLIGLERYRTGENAGMRTHALLSVGLAVGAGFILEALVATGVTL